MWDILNYVIYRGGESVMKNIKIKRIMFWIVGIISVSLLFSCSKKGNEVKNDDMFSFAAAEQIGQPIENVCEFLEISEDELIPSKSVGRFDFNEPVLYENVEFTKYLLFGDYSSKQDVLYGMGYECRLEDRDEELSFLVTAIKEDLTELYGSPTTDAGIVNVIGEERDFSKYPIPTRLIERWSANDDSGAEIEMAVFILDDWVSITVEDKLSMLPNVTKQE